ncbi:hypothetical protein TVNIR_0861 [Thioalkalivibrio nitratireducens DSM 14787]|uniref:Uncharacterized protein n=1 Tax=Thioalkalivibrio nitratireducens (strain DSM 14787 / UNIQEM 213 / ALEN2) TaxID=1255043 RepID=L0DU76_THIND|nr:hypothetical protein TVNIR_0861 [Thioalkalivibrio nitratireducens DSM 14787]
MMLVRHGGLLVRVLDAGRLESLGSTRCDSLAGSSPSSRVRLGRFCHCGGDPAARIPRHTVGYSRIQRAAKTSYSWGRVMGGLYPSRDIRGPGNAEARCRGVATGSPGPHQFRVGGGVGAPSARRKALYPGRIVVVILQRTTLRPPQAASCFREVRARWSARCAARRP